MATTIEANHGLMTNTLNNSAVLQALVAAGRFNVNADDNLFFLPRDPDLAAATGTVRHAGNHLAVGV